MAARDFLRPKWQSTRSFFSPSSSIRNMSTARCLKSRVSTPASSRVPTPKHPLCASSHSVGPCQPCVRMASDQIIESDPSPAEGFAHSNTGDDADPMSLCCSCCMLPGHTRLLELNKEGRASTSWALHANLPGPHFDVHPRGDGQEASRDNLLHGRTALCWFCIQATQSQAKAASQAAPVPSLVSGFAGFGKRGSENCLG